MASTPAVVTTGTPSFAAPLIFVGGKDPEALVVADVNGDDHPDVVTANSYSDDVSVFLGTGGSLRDAKDFPVGRAPASIAVGDLNGDRHPDIVTTNGGLASGESEEITGSDDVSVLLGNGDGTFRPHVDYLAGKVPMGIAIADVNGDHAADLLTVNRHEGQVTLLFGDGTGAFGAPRAIDIAGLSLTRRLLVTDVDGDHVADIVVPDELGDVSVASGRDDGTFDRSAGYPTFGTQPVAVAAGDLDGDGQPDLVTANGYPASDVSVLLATNQSRFADPTLFMTGFAPHSVVLEDMNGDGTIDIEAGNVGDSTVSILLGAGDGTFAASVDVPTGSDQGNNAIAIADMNGDRLPDIITANYKPSSQVTVLLQQG